jgi:two-component system alkaline phosphatase synthesis response regulator PhoP
MDNAVRTITAAFAAKPIILCLADHGVFDEWVSGLSALQAFHVVQAHDVPNAADVARSCRPDLLLLSHASYDGGMQIACRAQYPDSPFGWLPAVVLQREGDVGSSARGPDGPDDILSFAHAPDIAAIRIRAVLRRERPMALTTRIAWGDLELRHDERRVLVGGHPVPLSFHEFNMLALMLEVPSRVWSRQELQRMVGGIRAGSELKAFSRALRTLRLRLTPHLGRDPIQSVWGQGYRLL